MRPGSVLPIKDIEKYSFIYFQLLFYDIHHRYQHPQANNDHKVC